MDLPDTRDYDSREDLLSAIKEYASEQGYTLVIKRSKPGKVWIKCDRGDTYRNRYFLADEDRLRVTGTWLIGCSVLIIGKYSTESEKWGLEAIYTEHHHDRSQSISAHPSLRKLTPEQSQDLRLMSNAGHTPREIRTVIKQTSPSLQLRLSDIYNAKARYRLEALASRTPIQALMDDLIVGGLFYRYKTDENSHITHLFMAHPKSLKLFKQHHDILLLDCTYRINRYKMPLLNIVGSTGKNTTIQLALVFMNSETESDYVWALLALREMSGEDNSSVYPRVVVTDRERALISASQNVFPQISLILCRWHIGKNVLKACKKHFETEETWDTFCSQWNLLINSISEPEYGEHLREFCRDQPVIPVTYCLDTWLLEWKEKLVKAWVDQLPHFGHTITSRIEGSHAKLKAYLATSTLGLKVVYDKVVLYWTAQHMDYDTKLALARSRTPHQCQTPIFRPLLEKSIPLHSTKSTNS